MRRPILATAAGVNYTYDGDGNRLEKSGGKIYWYGAGTEILDESDTSGNFTNEYVFFGGKRVAMRIVSSGTIYYYEDDMLGSARTMVQAGATSLCYDADFYPFGGERDITASCGSNYKFEGKERDTETGNDDFGARYYTSRLGRWLSADWSAVPAPVPYANLTNPQTLNLYAMVSDNPETFADLDGHQCGPAMPGTLSQCKGNTTTPTARGDGPDKHKNGANTPPQINVRLVVYYSSNLTGAQRAAADGQIATAQYNAHKIGINLQVVNGGTVDADKFLSSGGGQKGALNAFVGTNEDFSGSASASDVKNGKALIALNIAKNGDDNRIFQFELAQVLTRSHSKLPLVGSVENGIKDMFYTEFLNWGLDGSTRGANIMTLGGYNTMRKNAKNYTGPGN